MSSFAEDVLLLVDSVTWIDERHLLEFFLLTERQKPVVRVPIANLAEHRTISDFCHRHGLSVVSSTKKSVVVFTNSLGEQYVSWADLDDPREGGLVLYCALNEQSAAEAECAERKNDAARLGALLGYPPCCVTAYERMADDGIWIERLLPQRDMELPWTANKLAYALYGASLFPDYFPCALTCERTAALTLTARDLLWHHGLGELAHRHEMRMRAPVTIKHNVLLGETEGDCTRPSHDALIVPLNGIALHPDVHPEAAMYRVIFV